MKAIVWISKIFLVLILLLLLSTWGRWFVDTQSVLDQYQVAADTVTGINALKSGMGGAALIIGVFVILYFVQGAKWLWPVILSTSALLVTRLLSLMFDGYSQIALSGVVLEALVILAALLLWNRNKKNNTNRLISTETLNSSK